MFEIKSSSPADLVDKMAIISDISIDYRHSRPMYKAYCESAYKYCGEKYNLYPVKLIGATSRDLLALYADKCQDVHINPSDYTGDSEQLCKEIYEKYGESHELPAPHILRWTYETLTHWYVSELPSEELISLGV